MLHAMKDLLSALEMPANVQGKITGGIVVYQFTKMPLLGNIWMHVLRVVLGKHPDKKRQ
jgi:hypothetical protein